MDIPPPRMHRYAQDAALAHSNNTTPFHPCIDRVVKVLEQETNARWVVDCSDSEDILRSAERMLQGGWPDAGWTLTERIVVFEAATRASEEFFASPANKLLGLVDEQVADIVRSTVHTWNHTTRGDCGCN